MKDKSFKQRFVAFATRRTAILLRKTKLKFRKKGSFRQAKAMVIKMPTEEYCTVKKRGNGEYEEKKSRFLATAQRVTTTEEAAEFIKEIKKTYPDARHHVYAYLLSGGSIARYSDDGEPQGTGGLPVLELIRRSGAEDVCIVVTRYFGGILLGTGGLVRAYSAAAKAAIENAGVVTYEQYTVMRLNCGYSEYQKISNELARVGAIIDSTDFDAAVTVVFAVKSGVADGICNVIRELSAGKTIPEKISVRFDFR